MTTTDRRRVLAALLVVLLGGIGGWALLRSGFGPLPDPDSCVAEVAGHSVELDLEQAESAALIGAVGTRRGLPARAVSIALATAYQESDLRNLDYGDRDSLGLFQQRPSQGWGTPDQIMDPVYSTNAFYDELEKIEGYRDLQITDAAQQVQRSAFGDAYADHETDARALASALTGYSQAALSCTLQPGSDAEESERRSGLTARAEAMLAALEEAFGPALALGGFQPGGVRSGHSPGSTHYDGRAVDVFFRPVTPESRRRGWAVAQWAVANSHRLDIATVIFDDLIWTASRSNEGWREYAEPESAGNAAVLRHLDHVHIDVA